MLPECHEPTSHLLACVSWPMVHPHRHHFGKPVEAWCPNLHEPCSMNTFFIASTKTIQARAITCTEKLFDETVIVAIPLVE